MKIGITGHMHLGNAQDWVQEQLQIWLSSHDVQTGLTNLAPGTDMLFAEECLRQGIPYQVILPCEVYAAILSPVDRALFDHLLSHAQLVRTLGHPTPNEQAFLKAGQCVAQEADVLLAAWNGLPAKGLGGTADIVRFALAMGRRVIHLDTLQQTLHPL